MKNQKTPQTFRTACVNVRGVFLLSRFKPSQRACICSGAEMPGVTNTDFSGFTREELRPESRTGRARSPKKGAVPFCY